MMLSIKLADIRNDARDFRLLWLAGGVVREDGLNLRFRWEVVNVLGRRGRVRILCAFGVRVEEKLDKGFPK